MNGEVMMCKDCKYFHIDYPPLKDINFGRASCSKFNLFIFFIDMRKFNRLECVIGKKGDAEC